MKLITAVLFSLMLIVATHSALASDDTNGGASSTAALTHEDTSSQRYTQYFSIEAGRFQPSSLNVGNGDYNFQYGSDATASSFVEAGWAIRLLHFRYLGSISLAEGLGYTGFSGTATSALGSANSPENLRVNILALDSRLRYSADWFPWEYLVPFVDAGYLYSFYDQSGQSDLDSAQGGVGNFVAGAGLRFWVNRRQFNNGDFESRFLNIPFFISLRYSHVYPNHENVDMASDSWIGGVEIAL
jgi:hypothetical protein